MSRHAARLLCALGVALSLANPRPARAEDDATIEMARQRFREGVQFYDQHQFEKARLAFLQAYALKPHPSVLLNLAQSELRSGHPDDAATHFSQYLRINTSATDAERQETNAGFTIAKSRVGEVSLTVDPAGAQVVVDGADKGVAPLTDPLYLMPGTHTIEARSGDRKSAKSIALSAAQAVTVAITVRGNMAAAGAPAGAEAPNDMPEANDTTAPATEEPAPPKTEPVPETSPPGHDTGGSQSIGAWFAETPSAWILSGVGVVGVGVGITTALIASNDYSNANNLESTILSYWTDTSSGPSDQSRFKKGATPCSLNANASSVLQGRADEYATACARYSSRVSSGDTMRTVAIASTVVGAAALVGTVVYYFADRRSEPAKTAGGSDPRARVIPYAAAGQAGVGVFGTF
jgi:tetratricopeptide (TPR) repeat protein